VTPLSQDSKKERGRRRGAALRPQPRKSNEVGQECPTHRLLNRAGDAQWGLGEGEDHVLFEGGGILADQVLVELVNLGPLVVAAVKLFGNRGEVVAGLHEILLGGIDHQIGRAGLPGGGGGRSDDFVPVGEDDRIAGLDAAGIDTGIGTLDRAEISGVAVFGFGDGPEGVSVLDGVTARASWGGRRLGEGGGVGSYIFTRRRRIVRVPAAADALDNISTGGKLVPGEMGAVEQRHSGLLHRRRS